VRVAVALTSLVIAAVAAAPTPARAAQQGVNADVGELAGDGPAMVAGTGARWARVFMLWSQIEPAPGVIDERALDLYRQAGLALTARRVKLIVDVLGAPSWASATGAAGGPPARPSAFADFLGRLAGRLRGAVAAYEVWNEEDAVKFWGARPDAAVYARVLRLAYPRIKAADPAATVVFGGLTGNDYRYLAAAYRHGARGSFDAVSVHTDLGCELRDPHEYVRDPGGRISQWSFLGYRSVRRTMIAHGDRSPMWMTELGWSATNVVCSLGVYAGQKPGGVSEQQQAAYLTRAYACLAADPYVPVALWFQLRDTISDEAAGIRYGLQRLDGTPRPAWGAFLALRSGPPRERCDPWYAGPHVALHLRRDGRAHDVLVVATVRAQLGVARVGVRLDGRTIERRRGSATSMMLRIPVQILARRRHIVTVVAVDTAGNGGKASRLTEP